MKLLVISPEVDASREHAVLAGLFAAGLTSYHLRKPAHTRAQLAAYLQKIPAEFHPRIVLHGHHELAADFAIGGLHFRDADGPPSLLLRSRAVHDIATLHAARDRYNRLLVSPVFPSISKPGRAPTTALAHDALRAALALPRRAEVFALGGIDFEKLPACRALGFDGVALLGAIWQALDPIQVFSRLQSTIQQGGVAQVV